MLTYFHEQLISCGDCEKGALWVESGLHLHLIVYRGILTILYEHNYYAAIQCFLVCDTEE